jgi:hypothetical protein
MLHKDIYRGESIDEAVKVFADYATFELTEEDSHWHVKVTSESPDRERRIAGELANYSLGLTVKSGGVHKKASTPS